MICHRAGRSERPLVNTSVVRFRSHTIFELRKGLTRLLQMEFQAEISSSFSKSEENNLPSTNNEVFVSENKDTSYSRRNNKSIFMPLIYCKSPDSAVIRRISKVIMHEDVFIYAFYLLNDCARSTFVQVTEFSQLKESSEQSRGEIPVQTSP
ncbi:hypothetical protein M9H77_02771 [Catharanthus roseus]|uniref:Uncharacterized protein n=1 Tax=Catharanthus roseus TaxID=4058 RepID=A0ACC0C9S0_CATRO|nr:hypothetical protein M9H77_02771 [Catharanthus roseus]